MYAVEFYSMEVTMTGIRIFDVHRTWEDWIGIVLGVLIVISPWMAHAVDSQFVVMNAVIVGVLVLSLAGMEIVVLRASEEWLELASGLWLTASPFVFGYASSGELRYWHFVLGALVVLLAVIELWQDWKLSDKELARHGI
jgi:dolichyl-phosphate-mannose--protein O-mannosyl transferase